MTHSTVGTSNQNEIPTELEELTNAINGLPAQYRCLLYTSPSPRD